MMEIIKYSPDSMIEWNEFVEKSKNGTFLFNRNYMDYHSERFTDHSLMFYSTKSSKLIAVLPANIDNYSLYSHQGLSYGGMIYSTEARTMDILQCFQSLLTYAKEHQIKKILYKRIPYQYHQYPSDEDLYVLFRNGAKLIRRDIGYSIKNSNSIPLNRSKTRYLKKFNNTKFKIEVSNDFHSFYTILKEALLMHNAKPIHSEEELKFLTKKFPNNISLYGVFLEGKMQACCWLFKTKNVLHVQNMVASATERNENYIDYVYNWLINGIAKQYQYLSFGISTEQDGKYLNEGLAWQKESFGGRAICYDHYQLDIN